MINSNFDGERMERTLVIESFDGVTGDRIDAIIEALNTEETRNAITRRADYGEYAASLIERVVWKALGDDLNVFVLVLVNDEAIVVGVVQDYEPYIQRNSFWAI